jgi:hypothetical protein
MAVDLSNLPQLTARELQQKISVKEAAKLNRIHEDTYRKHFAHTIERLGPRLERVPLGVALTLGQPKRK